MFHSHSFTEIFLCIWGKCKCWSVCFFVFGKKQLNNCFWKIWVALKRAGLVPLVWANPLIWADSAGWTGGEVLTVYDEWKMALVMVLVEVERVKMVVVLSADTVEHLGWCQRGRIILKSYVDCLPVFLMPRNVG